VLFIKTTTIPILAIGLFAGSVVGVAAQDEAAPPVEFTAKWAWGSQIRSDTSEAIASGVQYRGGAWRPGVLVPASDPRWQGTFSIANNENDYSASGGPLVGIHAFRIENEEGAWQQMPTVALIFPGIDDLTNTGVFVGEGGYEGLIAVVDIATDRAAGTWDLHGYIIHGELPPPPDPFLSE
jgi:hypothetical protein